MTDTTHEHSEPGQPAGLGCNEELGGFFTEAMLAAATLKGEQEGRAYRGYCPACGQHTLRAFHRGHGIVGKACTACNVLVVLIDDA